MSAVPPASGARVSFLTFNAELGSTPRTSVTTLVRLATDPLQQRKYFYYTGQAKYDHANGIFELIIHEINKTNVPTKAAFKKVLKERQIFVLTGQMIKADLTQIHTFGMPMSILLYDETAPRKTPFEIGQGDPTTLTREASELESLALDCFPEQEDKKAAESEAPTLARRFTRFVAEPAGKPSQFLAKHGFALNKIFSRDLFFHTLVRTEGTKETYYFHAEEATENSKTQNLIEFNPDTMRTQHEYAKTIKTIKVVILHSDETVFRIHETVAKMLDPKCVAQILQKKGEKHSTPFQNYGFKSMSEAEYKKEIEALEQAKELFPVTEASRNEKRRSVGHYRRRSSVNPGTSFAICHASLGNLKAKRNSDDKKGDPSRKQSDPALGNSMVKTLSLNLESETEAKYYFHIVEDEKIAVLVTPPNASIIVRELNDKTITGKEVFNKKVTAMNLKGSLVIVANNGLTAKVSSKLYKSAKLAQYTVRVMLYKGWENITHENYLKERENLKEFAGCKVEELEDSLYAAEVAKLSTEGEAFFNKTPSASPPAAADGTSPTQPPKRLSVNGKDDKKTDDCAIS